MNIIVFNIFRIFVYPLVYFIYILFRLKVIKFETCSEMISLIPGSIGIHIRRFFLKQSLKKCGKNLVVEFGSIFSYPDVEIGDDLVIEHYCIISRCVIGNNVTIASNVSLMSGAYHHETSRTDIPIREQPGTLKTINIGDDVWIGTRSVIMNDVGTGSVIGAGAVVTKPVPKYSIAVGVPAKVIKTRR